VNGFRSEIKQGLGLLRNRKLQLIPSDPWMSAVNSGDLRLFCSGQKNDLRRAYFAISKESKRLRRAIQSRGRRRKKASATDVSSGGCIRTCPTNGGGTDGDAGKLIDQRMVQRKRLLNRTRLTFF